MQAPPAPPRPRRSLGRALFRGCLVGVVLALFLHAGYVLVGPNFHTVVPGAIYRSAQPDGKQMAKYVRRFGIRTVINLCGCCDPQDRYLEESLATHHLNISQEDLSLSAGRLPSVPIMRDLVEVLDRTEYPILIHCHRGIDRTGLVTAIALLLHFDAPLAQARGQLSPWRGHLPLGRTANLDRFFDLYQEWLAVKGLAHSREVFRSWITQEYCPGECRCKIELLEPTSPGPICGTIGKPFPLRVRCHNTSVKPWRLRPGSNAGIHVSYKLLTDQGRIYAEGYSGRFHAVVLPGQHIDLTLSMPALRPPGRYRLRVDMVDEQHGYFLQMGSEPLVREVVAR